jgi:hypothetical protein
VGDSPLELVRRQGFFMAIDRYCILFPVDTIVAVHAMMAVVCVFCVFRPWFCHGISSNARKMYAAAMKIIVFSGIQVFLM